MKKWTKKEINIVKKYFGTVMPVMEISKLLGRSISAINNRAHELKLKRKVLEPIRYTTICEICGKSCEFNYKRRTCSTSCARKLRSRTREEYLLKHPYTSICVICGKSFVVISNVFRKRCTCSVECLSKLRSILRKFSLKMQTIEQSQKYKEKQRKAKLGKPNSHALHKEAIIEEILKLEKQGYKCLSDNVKPDIIAMKNGKIYAYEVEFSNFPRYKKYEGITFFDDIIWIKRNREEQ